MAVSGSLSLKISATESKTNDFGVPSWAGTMSHVLNLANGTGANQFDLVWMDERTLASNTAEDLDLAGVLTSPMGTSIAGVEGVMIVVVNAPKSGAANTTALTIGGDTNGYEGSWLSADGTITVGPGGVFLIASPNASGLGTITAGTGDILQISNASGASNTYQIAVFARSA